MSNDTLDFSCYTCDDDAEWLVDVGVEPRPMCDSHFEKFCEVTPYDKSDAEPR